MSKVYGDIELLGGGEVTNLVGTRVSADPTFDAADVGVIIYNTTENSYKFNNGSAWVAFEVSLTSSTQLVKTLGDNWINEDLSFDPTDFNSLDNISGLTADDSLYSVIVQLDAGITDAKTVETLQGVPLNFVADDLSPNDLIYFDGNDFILGTINDIGTVDLSVSELSDSTITDPGNENFLLYSNGSWVNKPVLYQMDELSGTLNVFTVNHSLEQQFCHVTVIDRSFATPRKIDPAEITTIEYNSTSTLTVTLTGNKAVTILVAGVELAPII